MPAPASRRPSRLAMSTSSTAPSAGSPTAATPPCYVIYALTDPAAGMKGISAFIVERGRPGFTIGTVDHKLGIRSSNTVELLYQGRPHSGHQPAGQGRRGHEDRHEDPRHGAPGYRRPQRGPGAARAGRVRQACAGTPTPARATPGQTLQFKLADMQIMVEAARQTAAQRHAPARCRRCPSPKESAICKTFCSDVAMQVTTTAVSLMGSYGYTRPGQVHARLQDHADL